jgi:hypothetical protein
MLSVETLGSYLFSLSTLKIPFPYLLTVLVNLEKLALSTIVPFPENLFSLWLLVLFSLCLWFCEIFLFDVLNYTVKFLLFLFIIFIIHSS